MNEGKAGGARGAYRRMTSLRGCGDLYYEKTLILMLSGMGTHWETLSRGGMGSLYILRGLWQLQSGISGP